METYIVKKESDELFLFKDEQKIGQVSPDALSYVKEGDEFSEDDIRDGIQHPNGNSVKWKNDDGLPVYEIKGPCRCFH